LRLWLFTLLRLLWGIYFVLTSVYCLLAFLPYTFFALIKAPAYDWMPWFVHHQAALFFVVLAGIAVVQWSKNYGFLALSTGLVLAGVGLIARPFLPSLQNDGVAYGWSLISLLPLIVVTARDLRQHWPADQDDPSDHSLLAYSSAVIIAVSVALVYVLASIVHGYFEHRSFTLVDALSLGKLEITAWSVISHVLVAILIFSILNLIRMGSWRMRHPSSFRLVVGGILVFASVWSVLYRFLSEALSFDGWQAHLYAAGLAIGLSLLVASVVLPFYASVVQRDSAKHGVAPAVTALAISVFAIAFPTLIGGGDWNGVLQHSFTLLFWIVFGVCLYRLRPRRRNYKLATVLGIVILAGFSYKALQATAIFWGEPLGSTDDEVARALDIYSAGDVSFQMAHHLLGNARSEPCGDLCRILREYTNIRDAAAKTDVKLVDPLIPTTGVRPNIFIFVIDSVRADYLGAYNPRVDFTPNLDAFARDSVALRNVYTQYAGTTLSEPAIWSGTMLLHAHYMQPFSKVNGLEKLANTDGYQMMVSYDTVLSQILSPSDSIIKLDTDKPLWNRFEVCSTIQHTENALDARADRSKPVLFYAQPMNVHQFAVNNMPRMTSANWRMRPEFNNRIAYELSEVDDCLGGFFSYLKSRGLYDSSIIVVTSDHGDATGELGRYSHSMSIYPEVMRVPLIVHLPEPLRRAVIYDDTHLSALTDITPSLYYLLGHRPVRENPLFGHPLFVETQEELERYRRNQLFLASDERAVYGLLTDNGRFLYATYDSPAQSFLFDLNSDPTALNSILTGPAKKKYDEQIIQSLQMVGDFYGYKPGVGSLLAAAHN
jgi:hypothetical protein